MVMLDKIVKDLRLLPDALQCIRDGLMVVDSSWLCRRRTARNWATRC